MDKTGASAKHLDFHLQREKALTKDLEAKCKSLQAQIAQLEQEKAELRREKIALTDEIKRSSKLDERLHFLQRENEHKDELLAAEKAKVMDAMAETERVRSKASTSIAAWTEAERQWLAEQETLSSEITDVQTRFAQLTDEHRELRETHDEVSRALQKKVQQCEKYEATAVKLEADVSSLHAQLEKSQNKVFDLEQTIYRLDLAGVKQKEALSLKDTEINALEAKIAQHVQNEEKLEQAISSLSDRVNAAKMMDLQGKGEKEKLFCDFTDAQKEIHRLTLQIEAFKRDMVLASQTQTNLQSVVDELRAKCTTQLEEIKERSVQIRKDELTISQLQMDLNKRQSQNEEWEFRFTSLQGELRESQEHCQKLAAARQDEHVANQKLQMEIQALQAQVDAKEEAVVVASADATEKVEAMTKDVANLEREVQARQQLIKELTSQLAEANEKNASYHSKILEEADSSARVRQLINTLQQDVFHVSHKLFFSQCAEEKYESYIAQAEINATNLSSLFAHQWNEQQMHDLERIHSLEAELECVKSAHLEAQEILVVRSEALASAKIEIEELSGRLEQKDAALRADEAARAASSANLARQVQTIEEMKILLQEAEGNSNALKEALKNGQIEQEERQRSAVHHYQLSVRFDAWLADAEDGVVAACVSKNALFVDLCAELIQNVTHAAQSHAVLKDAAERRCRELEGFIKETKAAVLQKDVALAEKESAKEEKLTELQSTVAALEKEKRQISFQLNSLLARFEEERSAFEHFRTKTSAESAAQASSKASLEHEVAKLRKGIEYELGRKGEYKDALEKIRRLRDESESLRASERSLSEAAIAEANTEASYWIDAFDRLKRMIENAKSSGNQRLPNIDAETVSRLESAKSRVFGPIRDQDVNSGKPCLVQKRRRVDME